MHECVDVLMFAPPRGIKHKLAILERGIQVVVGHTGVYRAYIPVGVYRAYIPVYIIFCFSRVPFYLSGQDVTRCSSTYRQETWRVCKCIYNDDAGEWKPWYFAETYIVHRLSTYMCNWMDGRICRCISKGHPAYLLYISTGHLDTTHLSIYPSHLAHIVLHHYILFPACLFGSGTDLHQGHFVDDLDLRNGVPGRMSVEHFPAMGSSHSQWVINYTVYVESQWTWGRPSLWECC